jgi:hypothetical protein
VSITTPANGATYALGQMVDSTFSCTDVTRGPGIQSCLDQNGNPSGTPIDTSTAGSHAFTVTATNKDGLSGTASVSYTVAQGSQAIAFTSSPPSPAVVGASYTPAATDGGSGNPVVLSIDASSGAGVCGLDATGTTVSFTGAGTCVIDANQASSADYGAAGQQQQSFTVVNGPSAQIGSPAAGQTFALGQRVVTSFSYREGADGPGLSACTDSNGASAATGMLDISKTGTFTYTVTATSKDGQTATASIHYTVAAAPSVTISAPADGASYTKGETVNAGYSCQEGADGPGISACTGTVAGGQPIDTSTPGRHTFTVTATSRDGQRTTTTISYTILPPKNQFTVAHIHTHRDGTITFTVAVPGPGTLDVLETAWDDNLAHAATLLQPAKDRFAYARKHVDLTDPGVIRVRVTPNRRGSRLVRRHTCPVVIRLWVTYTPAGGASHIIGFYGLHLPK